MGSQRVAGEDRAGLARSAAAECDDKVDWRRIGGVKTSQLLEWTPALSMPRLASRRSAPGCTAPLGWLLALNAASRPAPGMLRITSPRIEWAELPAHTKARSLAAPGFVVAFAQDGRRTTLGDLTQQRQDVLL